MRITTLVENVSTKANLGSEHGLSLWIETNTKTILFDSGATTLFEENAHALGVDLSLADVAVLSHGHWDHSGGMGRFFEVNERAPLYVKQGALGSFYSQRDEATLIYAGLDDALKNNDRVIVRSGVTPLGEGITLFDDVQGRAFIPPGNQSLYIETEDGLEVDPFDHEHYLSIEEDSERVLISGCSHKGIVNIVEQYKELWGAYPTIVIGGFHLMGVNPHEQDGFTLLKEIAEHLLATKAHYYTGHCTGERSYQQLKEYMGEFLEYLPTGRVLEI